MGLDSKIESKVEVVSEGTMEGVREAYEWLDDDGKTFDAYTALSMTARDNVDLATVAGIADSFTSMSKEAEANGESQVSINWLRMSAERLEDEYDLKEYRAQHPELASQ